MNREITNGELGPGEIAPAPAGRASRRVWGAARTWWQRLSQLSRRPARRLRLCESLPLGERRFVAVVEFEQWRFLVGGTAASLVLLARLETNPGETLSPPATETSREPAEEKP